MKKFCLLLIFQISTLSLFSQSEQTDSLDIEDTFARQKESFEKLSEKFAHWEYTKNDTLSNPYYFLLFTNPLLYHQALEQNFSIDFSSKNKRQQTLNNALIDIYKTSPWLVRNADTEVTEHQPEIPVTVKPKVKLSEKVEPSIEKPNFTDRPGIDIDVRKPNFWTFSADFSLQLIQSYYSDNWYKGGESNNSYLAQLVAKANYNNKQKVTFNNTLEMKLGFQSSQSDEKHKYKTYSDLLRLTNELGLKASKHWYYSVMLQTWTQFYKGFKKNDEKVYSDFMSPFESILTLGMKYSLSKKRFSLNLNLSPLAADFKYVGREALITYYGLDENKHSRLEYGSNITATHTWNITDNISWKGRFYYYTNYKKAIVEWENTFALKVNKYLSTQIFVYPRFDDSVNKSDPEEKYIQLYEYLSLGVTLSF